MHQEISDQHQQKCVLTADPHRLRNHVGKRHRQHVPRAQRHKVMQETPRPSPPHHKQPTNQVPRSGHHPQPRRHPHSSCDVVIHFGVRQSCCRFRDVCIAKSCSAGRSSRSHAALLLSAKFLWRAFLRPSASELSAVCVNPSFSPLSTFHCQLLTRLHPECRNKITSPSCTTYSRPSNRTCAFSRAAAILPAASKSFHRTTSARINPFSMSL